ncbi:GDP-D-glucose phosphorylase 1 [Artemisia annua]|uniref:GDP-D-glucose phosphorylase 1 n=1 Tax=Artemisia annua TaxID=35608 RepID=A0A2U1KVD3_ARTAN|nr:GDP-D-glucose phosphorylase 1 [Artemisia annua]
MKGKRILTKKYPKYTKRVMLSMQFAALIEEYRYVEKQAFGEVSAEILDIQVNPVVWEINGHMVLKRKEARLRWCKISAVLHVNIYRDIRALTLTRHIRALA